MLSIVVAHAANRVIGCDGELPWRLPGDLRRFRDLTSGGTVLMGRRTFESLPAAFRPLPQRRNLVLSRDALFAAQGAEVCRDLDEALALCGGECYVIGGALTYAQALPLCERVYATEIDAALDGDALFPALAQREWRLTQRGEPLAENGLTYSFRVYERAAAAV